MEDDRDAAEGTDQIGDGDVTGRAVTRDEPDDRDGGETPQNACAEERLASFRTKEHRHTENDMMHDSGRQNDRGRLRLGQP